MSPKARYGHPGFETATAPLKEEECTQLTSYLAGGFAPCLLLKANEPITSLFLGGSESDGGGAAAAERKEGRQSKRLLSDLCFCAQPCARVSPPRLRPV